MTRRQIYFYNKNNDTYYVSEEFNGDKREMELFGMADSCDKTWQEILEELNLVRSLSDFLQAISRITGYYHSSVAGDFPGTRFHVCHSEAELSEKDETYVIYSDKSGAFLDKKLSYRMEG
jgi:hypothetical protein